MTNLAWNGIATGNGIQGKPADPGRNNSLKSDKETQSPLIRVFKEIMDRERGGDNERTNLLNENKNVNRNKIFTFTKYKNENAVGDSSSSEQNCEHPQHFRQKKPGVVRKLEDDFKVYRSRSDHQSKASTPSKKGSWWKWGQSDDRKAISSDSASRISCACKRLMCSDYVVMFILTVFFTFSTLLGLVIIFKAFPSLVIVPADDHLRLNRKVDRLTQLQTDGLIDSSLARNSRVGLKSNDYRSWNNPLPTGDPGNMHSFDDLNIADFRDSNQLAKPENGNSDFYKKLLRTAARFRKIKQNHRDTYDNDFVFGDMNRYKRSIGYPTRKHKRHYSPHAQYHNKVSRKSGNRKASVINKRHSEEPMGVVIEKKQMVLQFLGPHESKINSYHKPYNRWNKNHQKQEQKHISNEKNFQKNYHLTNQDHVMEKKFTDAALNGAFSDILRKGKDKFNHFLNHKNGYDFNTFDSFDNSQFDYLKHHELKDIEVNQNKEDTCQDIEKDKIASEKAMSNENPLNKGLSENTGNPTAPSTTENTVREIIERSTETTLELQKSTSAAMEKVPILRKLLQFDENYHEAEDYDHIKTKNKILMNPDLVDDVIVIETNEMDDKIKDTHNNDIEINIGDINDNLESFAEVEAAMIAEDKQSQASLNDNYGVVEIDVDDGFDLLQAYSDYGILQTPSDIGYKDKSKTSSQEEDSKTNMSKAENKTQTFLGNMSEKVKETSSAKRLVAKPYKIVNKVNNGIIRRKLLSINMDHSDTVNNSIVHNINTNTDKAAINEKEIANPEINQNTAKNSTTQILETKSSTTHNETKIVLKRNVPISDNDLIFWDDIYDDDAKSGSKIATQSVKADVYFAKKSDSKSNFGEWISDKLNNVVENIRNGMQRDPIKTNLKVHEVTRSVRDAKIPESTHDINRLDTENKNKTKREAGKSHEITSFAELEQNMKRICKEAVKAVEDIKNIKVNNKEKHSADGYLNNLLMGQLVSMMSDLVDYQVEQKTCLKLPPDLREFLIWLTSAEEANNKQDPLKTELDELQMDSDLLTSHKPSEPEPGHDPTSASSEMEDGHTGHVDERSECLGTLEDVQELMQEYQSLPEEEKTKMAGVKEYLEKQLDYLYKKLEATQDLNALPVLYTDPLLRKRRNHPNKRVNHPFRPSNHPPQRENHPPQRGNHPRTRVKRGTNKKTMTKSNRHKNVSHHRNSAKIKGIDSQKY